MSTLLIDQLSEFEVMLFASVAVKSIALPEEALLLHCQLIF